MYIYIYIYYGGREYIMYSIHTKSFTGYSGIIGGGNKFTLYTYIFFFRGWLVAKKE